MNELGPSHQEKLINLLFYKLYRLSEDQDNYDQIEDLIFPLLNTVDLNTPRSVFGHGIVHICAMKGLTSILKHLLDIAQLDLTLVQDIEQSTPLHLACGSGKIKTVDLILNSGQCVNVNAQDHFGMTPLHVIESVLLKVEVKRELCILLESKGADFSIRDNGDQTFEQLTCNPLSQNATNNNLQKNPFHYANYNSIQKKLNLKSEEFIREHVNQGDFFHRSPLSYMATRNSIHGTLFLCGYGGDPNLKDHQGRSPLFYACATASKDLIETLLQYQGDPYQPDIFGLTPIDVATMYERHDILLLFEKHEQADIGMDEKEDPFSSVERLGEGFRSILTQFPTTFSSWLGQLSQLPASPSPKGRKNAF